MRDIEKFRGDCHIRVWLCQIAKNCYYSYLKKAGKQTALPDMELSQLPDHGETVEGQFIQNEEVRQIRKLLHDIIGNRFSSCFIKCYNPDKMGVYGIPYFLSATIKMRHILPNWCKNGVDRKSLSTPLQDGA